MDIVSRWNYQHGKPRVSIVGKATDYTPESEIDKYIIMHHEQRAEDYERAVEAVLEAKVREAIQRVLDEFGDNKKH